MIEGLDADVKRNTVTDQLQLPGFVFCLDRLATQCPHFTWLLQAALWDLHNFNQSVWHDNSLVFIPQLSHHYITRERTPLTCSPPRCDESKRLNASALGKEHICAHLCLSLICSWKELVSFSSSELGHALSTGAAES